MSTPPTSVWSSGSHARITLDVTRGDDWAQPIRLINADTGLVLDLAGRTWAFEVETLAGASAATGTVTEDTSGTITLRLTSAQTSALTDDEYLWSVTETWQAATNTLAGGTLWVIARPAG